MLGTCHFLCLTQSETAKVQLGMTQFRIYLMTFAKHELSKWAAENKNKIKKKKKKEKKKKSKEERRRMTFVNQ